jgi:glycosyltransferase involved in cell wall biosynthesis
LPPRSTISREDTRKRLGARPEDVVVVQTSRLEEWKGQSLLLRALLEMPDLPWHLWFAGADARPSEHRLRTSLEALARSREASSRVTFLGERRDIGDILKAADIFCQPNLEREPYGIAIVEAMSHGLPVVITEEGAAAGIVGSEMGSVVRADAVELAIALRALIESADLRRTLGEASQARYLGYHSAEKTIARLARALEDFTAQSRLRAGVAAWA